MPNWVFIQLTFYIPPNLPRALGKGAVSSFFLSYPVGVSDRVLYLTRFFFLSSFFFWQHFWDLYLSHVLIDFNQTWSQEPLTLPQPVIQPAWGQRSCRGHRGQKGHFTKNATPPTDYRIWSRDSCTCIRLTPSTKVMGLKIHLGSFGVTGVKRSFSPKMLLLLQITWHGYVTHAYPSARSPLSKLWVLKLTWGHLGSQGSKGHFH